MWPRMTRLERDITRLAATVAVGVFTAGAAVGLLASRAWSHLRRS